MQVELSDFWRIFHVLIQMEHFMLQEIGVHQQIFKTDTPIVNGINDILFYKV